MVGKHYYLQPSAEATSIAFRSGDLGYVVTGAIGRATSGGRGRLDEDRSARTLEFAARFELWKNTLGAGSLHADSRYAEPN